MKQPWRIFETPTVTRGEDYPILEAIWNNEDDAAYDRGMPRLATAVLLGIGAMLAGGAITLIVMAFWPERGIDPWR